jgi:GntR family transcriptional regulator
VEIVIDIDDSLPVFAQLIEQIKKAVLGGKLGPGDALPSIRQLGNDLELNNKTVAKAYKLLERDSIIQTRGYRGTFIHPDARANCSVNINDLVITRLNSVVTELRSSGVTDSEIRIAFGNVMNSRNN